MRKKFLPAIAFWLISPGAWSQNNTRLFDQSMRLKNVSITIRSDAFVASTSIELEFYNPNDKEVEGLYRFQLDPGQAITAFQLELNGKYRDGSIEERWKARSAYSSIVGKRMDPALLQYEYNNNYRLNIFPVPARGSRKITMTIQQLLSQGKQELIYRFPFHGRDTATHFEVDIKVNNVGSLPVIKRGLLAGKVFNNNGGAANLNWVSEKLTLSGELSFAIPLVQDNGIYCVKSVEHRNYYAIRLLPQSSTEFDIHPKKLAICWDASGSALKRNLRKEISFLQQYISYYGISQLTIIPFSHAILDTAVFYTEKGFNSRWEQYLRSLNYDGATQLGCLDLATINADVVFIFSDGKNSYGRSMPNPGSALVYCINSVADGNTVRLQEIVGSNGGKCIDLSKLTTTDAIIQAGKAQNWLLRINSTKTQITSDQPFPMSADKSIILTGMLSNINDTLTLYYGHGDIVSKTEDIYLEQNNCAASTIEKISMLQKFSAIHNNSWNDVLDFGLKEKVITANTSYIVLEKVEDYIKYNIAPPKDLEEECQKLNYVKKDTKSQRQKLMEMDEFDIVNKVVDSYNEKIKQWSGTADTIQLTRQDYNPFNTARLKNENTIDVNLTPLQGTASGLALGVRGSASLSEVVVVGYGTALKRNLTGSITYVRGNQILPGLTIQQNLAGRVAGVTVQASGNSFTSPPQISVRGISSMVNNTPLYVIDGMAVRDDPNNYINVADIESITVLKDAAATAIYGSNGGNGVIIINSKKPGAYSYPEYGNKPYRLKDMEDVEYMQALRSTPLNEKLSRYDQLRLSYGNEPGFYFDVAQHFFEIGLKPYALSILLNAAEVSDGDLFVLKAIGYTFENWKYFDEAVEVYEQILQLNPFNLSACRDLAWAYYQKGNFQKAVEILYQAIKSNPLYNEDWHRSIRANLLNDMNAMIAIHRNKLDISMIPAALLKPLPVDLRIMVDGNKNDVYNMIIIEPGGSKCSLAKPVSKNGGYLNRSGGQYFYGGSIEYQIKNAVQGKYKIRVRYYDYYQYPGRIPSFIRIMSFRNFGKIDQSISVENVIMDNQYGEIEIGELKWGK